MKKFGFAKSYCQLQLHCAIVPVVLVIASVDLMAANDVLVFPTRVLSTGGDMTCREGKVGPVWAVDGNRFNSSEEDEVRYVRDSLHSRWIDGTSCRIFRHSGDSLILERIETRRLELNFEIPIFIFPEGGILGGETLGDDFNFSGTASVVGTGVILNIDGVYSVTLTDCGFLTDTRDTISDVSLIKLVMKGHAHNSSLHFRLTENHWMHGPTGTPLLSETLMCKIPDPNCDSSISGDVFLSEKSQLFYTPAEFKTILTKFKSECQGDVATPSAGTPEIVLIYAKISGDMARFEIKSNSKSTIPTNIHLCTVEGFLLGNWAIDLAPGEQFMAEAHISLPTTAIVMKIAQGDKFTAHTFTP